ACAGAMQELAAVEAPGDRVRRALSQVERCAQMLQEGEGAAAGDPPAALALFDDAPPARSALSIARLDAVIVRPGNNGVLHGDALQAYGEALAAFRAALVEHRGADDLVLLSDLLGRHAAAYAEAKRGRGALDFADLELGARDLLRDRPGLRAAIRARYERVMVDEFQDTNPLQLELLDLVAPEHLFAVGDEFQSIYGFRHADVEGFRRRRTSLGGRNAVRTLARNFRSRARVLGAVNAAFTELLGEGFVELVPGREDAGDPGHGPPVELLLTDAQTWEEHEERLGDTLPPVAACRRAEARLVAQRVADLVEGEGVEPAEVVVLVRAIASLEVFERALEDQGLATYASGGRGYWSAQQVLDLRAWLQALANPEEETALYGVLASPLVGVGADTLARLAMTRNAVGWGLWRTVEAAFGAQASVRGDSVGAVRALCGAVAPDEGERLAAFASRFATERCLASRLGLDALVERVVAATGYDLHVLALPGGERRMANVHKLVRLAGAYEAAHGRDLGGFLAFAAAEEEAGAREPEAPIELGGLRAVRLMTIHAAKGLEFPTVVLADLGRRPPARRPDLAVGDGVAGVRVIGFEGRGAPTAALERLTERALERAGAEERRVLYVGATRARDRLILSGALRLDRPPPQGPVAPPLAWLAPALVPALAAGPGGPAVELHDHVRDGQRVGVRVLRNTPETVGTVLREESLAPGEAPGAPPPGGLAAVRAGGPRHPAGFAGALVPPTSPALPALSHSALARYGECGYRFYLERVLGLRPVEPPSLPPEQPGPGGLDPRVRGVLVHQLLQRLDLAAPAPVESAELRTPDGARLSPAQAADVLAPVAAFARSPLRARLAAARAVRREVPFALPLGDGPLLTGVVDALADEDDARALVVDYKTDRLGSGEDPAGRVGGVYAAQRAAYALAALREGFATVEVAYAFLERPAEPVQARFTTADAPVLEAELLTAAAPLLRGEFAVTEGPHRDLCATCPGRGGLCPHPDERTLGRGASPPTPGS
ncbi:MAG TPA: 3'-5' exonuclease, partial [Solirubrobacteraceae bacterium]|nr:3'-5' exonuclease [Solirubrobacteraceae bacterium]